MNDWRASTIDVDTLMIPEDEHVFRSATKTAASSPPGTRSDFLKIEASPERFAGWATHSGIARGPAPLGLLGCGAE